ncbi:2-amino-4-hydroxy-6-hydroxymethyldihydropteridine diphosphokinase [Sphingomonas sp. KR1UV-12]|uniref:2-amino-4-hydroxy-6-hydroxymethyldihydropteridine pyrophosphokinase n=1 Tax=Sphingomonas aurea TaxID=3063994 RepID=A0ABT9EIZ5_9SPHN|nr:2-amino-4-hydroxy-6-hydroxymethyldihydropteridine diphosphokinase [Sphingomonas sp. KR1UV-12]MDP1026943.1 2-amino-4-hydroxy-6-hydroxymethyldihydropteridine diphosphokinase [Sphingomonas sp. KR1UV-12]
MGGNRRTRHGSPAATLRAALAMIGGVEAVSPVIATPPLGPSIRRFANAAALIRSAEPPPVLLARLKAIERSLGRRPGRRWGARPIDLDIVLWSGGRWRSRTLAVPHLAFRDRRFVLAPLARIVPCWRDPVSGRTIRQLLTQVDRRRPST